MISSANLKISNTTRGLVLSFMTDQQYTH